MPTTLHSDPNDPELSVVDTTPAGADPGVLVSFDTSTEVDEALDPAAYADEPWTDVDLEAAADGQVSFDTTTPLVDVTTYERWLQSALKALVAPDLGVDGKPGARTKKALERFQTLSPRLGGPALRADGVAGPKTIAALEQLTDSTAPTRKEGDPVASTPAPTTPPTSTNGITVREVNSADGATEYVISSGDDEVRFSYWTPEFRNYKPYNVSRYKGARKGLLKDEDFLRLGYSPSEIKILKANALKESGGAFGAINTWDDQLVSWGMAQFAGQAGTLAALLSDLKDDPARAPPTTSGSSPAASTWPAASTRGSTARSRPAGTSSSPDRTARSCAATPAGSTSAPSRA
jgi:hypothetical protein